MTVPRHSRLATEWSGRGLVLVELLLFLLVLGLAAAVLVAGLGRLRHHGRVEQLGTELQIFAKVFEQARVASGRWPATPGTVVAPLRDSAWGKGSPFGGQYGWLPPGPAGQAGMITLTAFAPAFPLALTRADLLEIDRRIDDGDLATGRFRTGFNGWPVYLVGDKP